MENRRHNPRFDSCGPFQFFHAALAQLTRFASAWASSLMMFGNYDPGWTCVGDGHPPNSSSSGIIGRDHNNEVTDTFNNSVHSSTIFYNKNASSIFTEHPVNWHTTNTSTVQVNFNGSCEAINILCDVIKFEPSTKTIVSEFGLICDQFYVSSVIISLQMVGMLLGTYASGQLGELFGRKVVLYSSIVVCSISCFLAIFSTSWQMYSAFIFFNGYGTGGIMVTCGVYSMEFLEPKWRAWLVGMPFYNVSLALFTVAIYLVRDWVYVHIATACLCALSCLGALWTPESLRWLILHEKTKQAKKVVKKINSVNKKDLDITDVLETILVPGNNEPSATSTERKYSYLDLLRIHDIRLVTVKCSIIWFCLILAYNALTFSVKSLTGDFYTNAFIAGISEIPFVLVVGPMSNHLGRRLASTLFMTLGTFSYVIGVMAYYALDFDLAGTVMRYAAFVAKGAAVAGVNTVNVFAVELYPTAVRNVGIGFVNTIGRIGAISAPYLIPRDQNNLVISYIILGLASLLTTAVILSLPETKNKSLQDKLVDESTVRHRDPMDNVNANDSNKSWVV